MFIPILFAAILIKQLLWNAFIPVWQFPDEQAHFAQVQNVVEQKVLALHSKLTTSQEIYESEKIFGTNRDGAGNNKYTYHPEYVINYGNSTTGTYEDAIKNYPKEYRKTLVINEATGYPPLYYVLSSFFYNSAYATDLLTRVHVVRLVNFVLFLLTCTVLYNIAKILFSKNKLLQVTLLLLVSFHPMLSFVTGGINSDILFNLLFTVAIYQSLRIIRSGLTLRDLVLIILSTVAALWTKPQGVLIVLIYLFPLSFILWKYKKERSKILLALGLVVCVGFGYTLYKLFTSQQIFPELPGFASFPPLSLGEYITHVKSSLLFTYRQTMPWYWGVFRWLSLTYPRFVHRSINIIVLVSFIGLGKYIYDAVVKKKALVPIKYVIFLLYIVAIYFMALVSFDYLFTKFNHFSFGIQGRYFFPVISAQMGLILIGLYSLMYQNKFGTTLIKVIGILMISLHTYSLLFVSNSYYLANSLAEFFVRNSQYKPWFFKIPTIYFLIAFGLLSHLLLLWYYVRIKQENEKN